MLVQSESFSNHFSLLRYDYSDSAYDCLKKAVASGYFDPEYVGNLLIRAAYSGEMREVKLLWPVAICNEMQNDMEIAFCIAAHQSHLDILHYMYENGADWDY